MSTAALDRLLALLVAALVATGLLSLRAGSPPTALLFVVHGLLGGTLAVASVLKLRRSLRPALAAGRWRRLAVAGALTFLVAAALAGGFAWVASGRILSVGGFTILTLHIWAGLAAVPVIAVHLLPRRWRLLRLPRRGVGRHDSGRQAISRRALLAGGVLAALGAVAWGAAELSDRALGGIRRFTGSRWLPAGGIPPVTTFFGEGTPRIDVATWRLRVHGAVDRPLELSLEALSALGQEERTEILDCTSGWAMQTDWRGVPTASVLDAAAPRDTASRVVVRSVTGWYARLPLDEARRTLLATGVAGADLPAGNGAPLRLVCPDRRGLEWVKWVAEIEVS
jgi:DMSO/TMAO reductase YedYZ molybdopterin-dependent catalytic subunit